MHVSAAIVLLLAMLGMVGPTPSQFPDAAEARFVAAAQRELRAKYPTTAAARRAGYFQYTDEDPDGIISYTNLHWQSDPHHPSQLWYDARGRLIGADFSQLVTHGKTPPNIWGLSPERWTHFIEHVHFGVHGEIFRYGAVMVDRYRTAGGDERHPIAHPFVKMGLAKRDRDVDFVFDFPELWVASIWLIPNPLGAFAGPNPNVPAHRRNARNPHLPM